MRKKIAIVGGGLSGIISANILHPDHDITLFESKPYLGGHCSAFQIKEKNGDQFNIDLGFVLFNQQAYPKLLNLFKKYHIPLEPCNLSFSFYSKKLIQYKGPQLGNPFRPWVNLFSPNSYNLFIEIIKFNYKAKKYLSHAHPEEKFGDFITKNNLTPLFLQGYLLPLMNTLWSCPWENLHELPCSFVLQYLHNNALLESLLNPQWYFVKGGAQTFAPPLCETFKDKIFLNTHVKKIERDKFHVILHANNKIHKFDALVLAVQADQALKMLINPSPLEQHLLGSFQYIQRTVYLHTDKSLMPPQKKYWAALNYVGSQRKIMTYHVNKSQNVQSKTDYFISLSEGKPVTPGKILTHTHLNRPAYTLDNVHNQKRHQEINGMLNTYYAGSYWGYGTLEDAIESAEKACETLKKS